MCGTPYCWATVALDWHFGGGDADVQVVVSPLERAYERPVDRKEGEEEEDMEGEETPDMETGD